MRFLRDYKLTITTDSEAVIVRPPMRIVFSCDKANQGGLNKLNIQISDLNENQRSRIVKDKNQDKLINVELAVGYQNGTIETIFKGDVFFGTNARAGADYISSLQCLTSMNDYKNSFTSATVTTKEAAVAVLADSMPNTQIGKITQLPEIIRPKVLVGNPYFLFKDLTPDFANFYIDDEQIFIVKKTEVIGSIIPVVTSRTGLLNTPQREQEKVTFTTLMNPSLRLDSRCQLISELAPYLNGIYKIVQITYAGDFEGKEWQQTVTAFADKNFEVL